MEVPAGNPILPCGERLEFSMLSGPNSSPQKRRILLQKSKLATHIYLLFLPNSIKMTVKEEQRRDFPSTEKKGIGGGVIH